MVFAEKYALKNVLTTEEHELLVTFLKDCLDRKRLSRVKDVEYDKKTGEVSSVPSLAYTKSTRHFTLRTTDKRVSTLKSLPPRKTMVRGTIKNNHPNTPSEESDSDSEP
jgi:hypothetical protein